MIHNKTTVVYTIEAGQLQEMDLWEVHECRGRQPFAGARGVLALSFFSPQGGPQARPTNNEGCQMGL